MSKENGRKREKGKPNHGLMLSKHLKKVYPIEFQKSNSSLSLSSFSSTDSSSTDSSSLLNHKISLALRRITPSQRRQVPEAQNVQQISPKAVKRCNWITESSDKVYVQFHDECWGIPVYDDIELFELLAMSGMLMDYNWTQILKRKELLREAFGGFDPNNIAKMGEKEILEIASNRALMLAENRVRCIVDNAKCIVKIVKEFGSFGGYMWGHVNYKPVISKIKHPRNVPLRTPKAEAISRDLLKRGLRFVGPVIVYSFMQAAGLSIDHLVGCFRFSECVSLAHRPWTHI